MKLKSCGCKSEGTERSVVLGCDRLNGMSCVCEAAHGSQISSAIQKKKKEEEDMGTCGPKLLMGARRPGAVGSVWKLNPTLIRCSAFTWSPKLEKPLTFKDKNIPKNKPKKRDLRTLLKILGF